MFKNSSELNFKKTISDYFFITLGVILVAVSVTFFIEPNHLITGGVTGLGIIIKSVFENNFGLSVPLWLTNALLNIPLFIFGWIRLGFSFVKKTLYATVLLSASLFLTTYTYGIIHFNFDNVLLAAIYGGVICGAGLGFVFKSLATTGGSDLAAMIIHSYAKHIPISQLVFIVDTIIICLGFFLFGEEVVGYAIISLFITSKVIQAIMEGLSFAKAAFIISEKSEEISMRLTKELDRSATGIHAKGMYTKQAKMVLLCVVSTKEIVNLKQIVAETDKNAFVIVADVREVLGEGFQQI